MEHRAGGAAMRHTGVVGAFRELFDRIRHRDDPYPCRQAVELVTDYLEGAMPPPDAAAFERHLRGCDDCVRYLEQVRLTVDTLGRVHPAPPEGRTRAALLATFKDFHER